MVGEQEEGNLSKLIIGGEMKLRRLPPLFPPLCVLHWERASSSAAHWFSSPVPLILLKSSSERENNGATGARAAVRRRRLEKMSPAEKKVRLRMGEQEIDLPQGWKRETERVEAGFRGLDRCLPVSPSLFPCNGPSASKLGSNNLPALLFASLVCSVACVCVSCAPARRTHLLSGPCLAPSVRLSVG